MRLLHKSLLTAAAILSLTSAAQAQTICSGAGIHQSCTSKPGTTTQINGNTVRTSRLLHNAQQAGNTGHNSASFGTPLNTGKHAAQAGNNVNRNTQAYNNLQAMQK